MHLRLWTLLLLAATCVLARDGSRVQYVGGTVAALERKPEGRVRTTDEQFFLFEADHARISVPYEQINLVEYGQNVDRRYVMALLVSPMFLLSKSRAHFLTVGYTDDKGQQQAMIFRVSKGDIRALLVTLEARTGRKVQFQDEEARKRGKA